MEKHENKQLRWIREGLSSMYLHNCINEAQVYDEEYQTKRHEILKQYDLLCAVQCEYMELPLLWKDIANDIVSESQCYLKRIAFKADNLRVIEICMSAALLLDDMTFVRKFAKRFIKGYERIEKQKMFGEYDYDDEYDVFLAATSLYYICNFCLDTYDINNLSIIPSNYKHRFKNTSILKYLQKILFSLSKNDVTNFTKYLQAYLQAYISREHYGMSYLYRHYSPLASIIYSLACKINGKFCELDKITMACKKLDQNETFRMKTYNVYVTDFILSSRLLHQQYCTNLAKKERFSRDIISKKTVMVPLEAETIDYALQIVEDGGTVLIKPGKYDLSEIINIKKNVIIKGESNNSQDVVLLNQKSSVMIITAPRVTLNNLSLTTSNIYADALIINQGNVVLSNCRFISKEKTGVLVNGIEAQLQIEDSVIENCRDYGLKVQNKAKATIKNCVFLKCICSVELSSCSECLFYDTQLSGTIYLHNDSKTIMTCCTMNSSITACKNSTASFIACNIFLPQMQAIGAADQSEILCSECNITSISKNLSPIYATTSSLIALQRCSISTLLKKFIREDKGGQVNVLNVSNDFQGVDQTPENKGTSRRKRAKPG